MLSRAFTLSSLLLLAPACASTGEGGPATGDDPADTATDTESTGASDVDQEKPEIQKQTCQGNHYCLVVVLASGLQQKLERNLDDRQDVIAFGSSHIGTAVSLAINDIIPDPFASIAFNFGFVVGSNDYPVTITDPDRWPWGKGVENAPPALKIEIKDEGVQRKYGSWLETADGNYDIEQWGTSTGEIVKGTVEGTLVADSAMPGEDPKTLYVTGSYQFSLPKKGQGQ